VAKTDFPGSIDRRRLLVSVAAVPAISILAGTQCVEPPSLADAAELPSAVPALNVSAATARRLLEIERRNEIRREANLPLLSITKELRRMKEQELRDEFSRFKAVHGKAVWEQVLKPLRDSQGADWRPRWMEAVGYQNQVHQILFEQFHSAGAARGIGRKDI
jgi:hypothetical protein